MGKIKAVDKVTGEVKFLGEKFFERNQMTYELYVAPKKVIKAKKPKVVEQKDKE